MNITIKTINAAIKLQSILVILLAQFWGYCPEVDIDQSEVIDEGYMRKNWNENKSHDLFFHIISLFLQAIHDQKCNS